MTPRCILITGAGSGIGAGIAAELASAGHHLVVTDVNPDAAEGVAASIRDAGGSAEALALDVTSDDSVAAALAAVSRPVEVLVNNAGLQHVAPLEEFPIAKWDFLVQVMLVGVARLTRAVLPGMRERGSGVIINVASLTGLVAMPLYSLYAASKFAVVCFSQSLSQEQAPLGIRDKVFTPGAVATDFSGRSLVRTFEGDGGPYADSIAKALAAFGANRGAGNAMTPEQLAQALYGAATDGSAQVLYATGDDAREILKARKELGEEALLSGVRQRFGLAG